VADKKETDESEKPADEAEVPTKRRRGRKAAARPVAAKKVEKPSKAALQQGEVHVYSVEGKPVKTIELPPVFDTDVRFDLIRRAVTAFQANRRQTYGASPDAGMQHSVRWSGKGHGVSRVPRLRGGMTGAQAPGTVGGRRAHPPRLGKIWSKKVNERERRAARNAAIAALRDSALVSARGHRYEDDVSLPLVVEDALESLEPEDGATREGLSILEHLGVLDDVNRAKDGRHIRAGHGKMRGRKYREPRSILVVVKDVGKARKLFGNLSGVEVVSPAGLNAEILAPGGAPGRLALFSEGALEVLRSWST
jgi:large subunit ribosomal protein L4e